ncbi:LysR family transcriptional regulator [Alcaligenaceae bacterium]|nr:LysR family transcriptional regulator [Alcaligenaceae bacterium]
MKMNFNQLSTFLAVAENSSFREASTQVHLSLPAVSMQIKQLEERLGVALFHRTTRRVELTPDGELLMISARKAIAELDAAFERIQRVADLHQGNLSFACVPTIAGALLPPILTRFSRDFPGIMIKVREMSQPDLLTAIRKREVDFGIGLRPDAPTEFEYQPLFDDDYVAVFPADHKLAGKRAISFRELSKIRLMAFNASHVRAYLLEAAQKDRLSLDLSYEFTHVNTVIAMIEAGLGVGILPAIAVPRGASTIKALRIVRPSLKRSIAIVKIRGHSLSPAAMRFIDICVPLVSAELSAAEPRA